MYTCYKDAKLAGRVLNHQMYYFVVAYDCYENIIAHLIGFWHYYRIRLRYEEETVVNNYEKVSLV